MPKLHERDPAVIAQPASELAASIVQTSPRVPALPSGVVGPAETRGVSVSSAVVAIEPVFVTVTVKPIRVPPLAPAVTSAASAALLTVSCGVCGMVGQVTAITAREELFVRIVSPVALTVAVLVIEGQSAVAVARASVTVFDVPEAIVPKLQVRTPDAIEH